MQYCTYVIVVVAIFLPLNRLVLDFSTLIEQVLPVAGGEVDYVLA